MDRVTLGFLAGTVGCIIKSSINAATNHLNWMGMRNSTVGTDLVLGKTIMHRTGTMPWIVGEIASSQLGGFWGTVFGVLPPTKGKNTWIARGVQLGSLAWMIDMALGARSIPRAVQGNVSPHDALMWWVQHQVFGLFTTYVLEVNPNLLGNTATKLQAMVQRKIPQEVGIRADHVGHKVESQWASEPAFYIE